MELLNEYVPGLPVQFMQPTEPRQLKPLLVTVQQAAKSLALSDDTVRQLCYAGELQSVKHGRALRVVYADMERWVEEKSNGPTRKG